MSRDGARPTAAWSRSIESGKAAAQARVAALDDLERGSAAGRAGRAVAGALPHTTLINTYGLPNARRCPHCHLSAGWRAQGAYVSLAARCLMQQLYVLDERIQPAPIGVAGEIYVGGAGVGRGYLNRPDLTAERFLPHPFASEPGARLYRTGDLGRWLADGQLDYLGRSDHQVKLRGHRVELGEVEAALLAHGGVRQAAAVIVEPQPGDKRLAAYVVAAAEGGLDLDKLRDYLRERLPEYMVPGAVVLLDQLPLTPNGKLDRKALPAPDWGQSESARPYVNPRNPVEEILAGIWAEVLQRERVGVHDNFFELGGHSLLATQVVSRMRKAFGVELPLRALFEAPTVEGWRDRWKGRAGDGGGAPPLVSAEPERSCRCRSRSRGCGSSISWSRAARRTTFRSLCGWRASWMSGPSRAA